MNKDLNLSVEQVWCFSYTAFQALGQLLRVQEIFSWFLVDFASPLVGRLCF